MLKCAKVFIFFMSLGQLCFAQDLPALILGITNSNTTSIQIYRKGNDVVFQLGRLAELDKTPAALSFGPRSPYPISYYRFAIPSENCSDLLQCDGQELVPMEEVHITNQIVRREARIRYFIDRVGPSRHVEIFITNDKGETIEMTGDLPVI
jgi:hypothetical protein